MNINIFLINCSLFAVVVLQSCGAPQGEQPEGKETSEAVGFSLTPEQMLQAGIAVGKLPVRHFEGKVRLLGQVVLPPGNRTSLHAPAAGYVRQAPLQPGAVVRKGEVVCVLEHPDYVVKQRELLEVKAGLPFLEADLLRKKELLDKEAGSLKNYQAASAEYERQKARYQGLRAELLLLGFDVERIERDFEFQGQLVLRATSPGTLLRYDLHPGKFVEPQMPLAEWIDLGNPWAEMQVYARHLPALHPGMRLQVQVLGSNTSYQATVRSIIPLVNEETKTATLRAEFAKPDAALIAGTALQADVLAAGQDCPALLKENVHQRNGTLYALAQSSDGTFEPVPVQIECEDADWYGIRADTSKLYVVKGGYYLNDRLGTE